MSSGFWIKMRRSLSSDPDVFRIGELTGLDRFSVVGRLHAIWSWADEHNVANRDAVSVTHSYVDRVADHDGFADAMRQVGWLAGSDGALVLPNFERHNGRDAKRKAQNAVRNQHSRSRPKSSQPDDNGEQRDARSVTEASPKKRRVEKKRSRKESTYADYPAGDLDEFVEAWNESSLTQCRKLTDKRRKALRTRLADADWKASWREALDRAAKSSFCRGQNDRGWKADVDWFLKTDSVVKLLEGKYDDQAPRTGQQAASDADAIMERHTAEVLARKRAKQAECEAAENGCAK